MLSQWRGSGDNGNGVAIGISEYVLNKIKDSVQKFLGGGGASSRVNSVRPFSASPDQVRDVHDGECDPAAEQIDADHRI